MNKHYEKSTTTSGPFHNLFGGLSLLFLVVSVVVCVVQLRNPNADSTFNFATTVVPLFLLAGICFAASRLATRGSSVFYFIAVGAVLFVILAFRVMGWFFEGFTPG